MEAARRREEHAVAEDDDRDERHVQAMAESLRRALVAGSPDEALEELTRAALGDEPSAPPDDKAPSGEPAADPAPDDERRPG